MKWQTMETAPRDGREILLWDVWGQYWIASWMGPHRQWSADLRDLDEDSITNWCKLVPPDET